MSAGQQVCKLLWDKYLSVRILHTALGANVCSRTAMPVKVRISVSIGGFMKSALEPRNAVSAAICDGVNATLGVAGGPAGDVRANGASGVKVDHAASLIFRA